MPALPVFPISHVAVPSPSSQNAETTGNLFPSASSKASSISSRSSGRSCLPSFLQGESFIPPSHSHPFLTPLSPPYCHGPFIVTLFSLISHLLIVITPIHCHPILLHCLHPLIVITILLSSLSHPLLSSPHYILTSLSPHCHHPLTAVLSAIHPAVWPPSTYPFLFQILLGSLAGVLLFSSRHRCSDGGRGTGQITYRYEPCTNTGPTDMRLVTAWGLY